MATVDPNAIVEEKVNEWLAELVADPSAIRRDATMEELDVDSLDLVEVAQLVEEEWGVRLGQDDVKDVKTVGDAVDLIAARVR